MTTARKGSLRARTHSSAPLRGASSRALSYSNSRAMVQKPLRGLIPLHHSRNPRLVAIRKASKHTFLSSILINMIIKVSSTTLPVPVHILEYTMPLQGAYSNYLNAPLRAIQFQQRGPRRVSGFDNIQDCSAKIHTSDCTH